jgi:hypothetical protein
MDFEPYAVAPAISLLKCTHLGWLSGSNLTEFRTSGFGLTH